MAAPSPDRAPNTGNDPADTSAAVGRLMDAGLSPDLCAELLPAARLADLVSKATFDLAVGLGQRFGRGRLID